MAVYVQKIAGAIASRWSMPEHISLVESVATPASDTATAAYASGGWFIVFNGEAGAIKLAWGTTPDADATAATSATTAFLVIASGVDNGVPIWLAPAGKFEWKAA